MVGSGTAIRSLQLAQNRFIAADGTALPLRSWLPEGNPKAVILGLHGFNDYSNAFAVPATAWAEAGFATFAYDQRSFGDAPQRGRWPGSRALIQDAVDAALTLRDQFPAVPLYLLGESMGGAVAILAMTGFERPPVDGVILVAPAVWGRQTMPWWQRVGLSVASILPAMHVSVKTLPVRRQASDNISMLRAYSGDALVIKETRTDAVAGLVDLMSKALDAATRLDAPALILYGEHDQIVPRAPVASMISSLPATARGRQHVALYSEGWHMLLRDLNGPIVVRDILSWMQHESRRSAGRGFR
jgi:alpha-beta hydrolase superfamily lysophospholipase